MPKYSCITISLYLFSVLTLLIIEYVPDLLIWIKLWIIYYQCWISQVHFLWWSTFCHWPSTLWSYSCWDNKGHSDQICSSEWIQCGKKIWMGLPWLACGRLLELMLFHQIVVLLWNKNFSVVLCINISALLHLFIFNYLLTSLS